MPRIERDGLEIHYNDVGSGRPIVLLHGFLFSSEMWAPQIERLREHNRVIAIDFRGHGKSSPVKKPFTLYDLVSDVVMILDRCEVERAVWVGHSMGGMVAMRAAIVVPEAVEALVLIDTDSGKEAPLGPLRYRAMAIAARVVGIRPFVSVISGLTFGSTTHRERRDLLERWKKHFRRLNPRSVRNALEAVVRRDVVTPMLHEVDAPTLVLVGVEDRTLPPHRSRTIAEAIDGARLETIEAAGHMASLERPDAVNELIVEFLRSSSEVPHHQVEEVEESRGTVEPEPLAPATDEEPEAIPEEEISPEAGPPVPDAEQAGEGSPVDEERNELFEPEDVEVSEGPGEPSPVDEKEPVEETVAAREETSTEPIPEGAASPPVTSPDLQEYFPEDEEVSSEPKELSLPGGKKGRERRGKRRVSPSRKLYGRVGHIGILLVDVSESGARVEHYDRRFQTGSTITLEIEWEGRTMKVECQVVSSRVHRFIPGDKGATVYQSGLLFRRMSAESAEILKELVARLVTRGLAEQVANARGIGPVLQNDMPTFRSGVVDVAGRSKETVSEGPVRLIRQNPLTETIGYIRCRKVGARWEKKWTLDPEQPREGFTVLASENKLEVDMLCETWDNGDEEAKKFIRDCARMSILAAKTETAEKS